MKRRALQIAAVRYLNTEPLLVGLRGRPEVRLRLCKPARCAELLRRGGVDLSLVPVAALAGRGEYRIVPHLAIGARGPVRSVVLFSRVPPARIRRLALDTSSRTSVVLARLWLRRRWGIDPRPIRHRPDLKAMLRRADAALLIGDYALASRGVAPYEVDLGNAWWQLERLPFVFAVWAGRDTARARSAARLVAASAATGLRRKADVARAWAESRGGDPTLVLRYLRRHVRYQLGPMELRGLRRFLDLAAAERLLPPTGPLRFLR